MSRKKPTEVFVNCPFDEHYKPLFVALISALTTLGLTPRTVLDVPFDGSRLERLFKVMKQCSLSIHDLSRIDVKRPKQPRFNMPFEIGMTATLNLQNKNHIFCILESKPFRVIKTLSDLNGYDAIIHGNTPKGVLKGIYGKFTPTHRPGLKFKDFENAHKALLKSIPNLLDKKTDIYDHAMFAELVVTAQRISSEL